MNEFLRKFIMTGVRDMIKNGVALYQTYQYASGWFSKGVLIQEDLEEIQRLYEQKETQVVTEETEQVSEQETEQDEAQDEENASYEIQDADVQETNTEVDTSEQIDTEKIEENKEE